MKKRLLCLLVCCILTAGCVTSTGSAYYAVTITKTSADFGYTFKKSIKNGKQYFEGTCPFYTAITLGCWVECNFSDGLITDYDYMKVDKGESGLSDMLTPCKGQLCVYNKDYTSGWSDYFYSTTSVSTKKIKHTGSGVTYKVYLREK